MVPPPNAKPEYYGTLIDFMSFLDSTQYTKASTFTDIELITIQPDDIKRWMCMKVYGDPDPGPDDNPTEGRSSSLEHYKKCLSYYMPNKLTAWNVMTSSGNPSRSIVVNDLIKVVKKKEVRKQGKGSQARRPIEAAEFEQTVHLLEQSDDLKRKYMVATAAKFQYAMVARVDDTAHFKEEDLKPNPQFSFALTCRMCWSKNVMEERDAPDQILLGSMDSRYCILVALGIYLELWLEDGGGATNEFVFGHAANAKTTKKYIADALAEVWKDPGFVRIVEGFLGSHSLRKYPATKARRSGCSKDDVDNRGRWRKKRVGDRYVDINLPYPDAKVAAVLCTGGPCKYALKNGSGVSNMWLVANVVPYMVASPRIKDGAALVLAKPILWACFEQDMQYKMPHGTRARIRAAYELIRGPNLTAGENPVKKIPLLVTGIEAEVHIDEIEPIVEDGAAGGVGEGGAPQVNQQMTGINYIRAMHSQIVGLRRELQESKEENSRLNNRTNRQLAQMNRSINRIALQPARRVGPNQQPVAAAAVQARNMARLSKNPRTLYILWHEFEFGIAGRKAAKDFTVSERGRVKYAYHRRKVVWEKIQEMIRGGWSANTAMDAIYGVYGRDSSVTSIINRMRADRINGGHRNLRV